MRLNITNPSRLAGQRWCEVAIPQTEGPLVSITDDGRTFLARESRRLNDQVMLYDVWCDWRDGEGDIELEFTADPEQRWCDGEFINATGVELSTLLPISVATDAGWGIEAWESPRTELALPHHVRLWITGYAGDIGRLDVWLDLYSGQRAIRTRVAVTVDPQHRRDVPASYVTLAAGAELATDFAIMHGLTTWYRDGRGGLAWEIPVDPRDGARKIPRCTIIRFDGYLLPRPLDARNPADTLGSAREDTSRDHELVPFRFGPSVGMAAYSLWDGAFPPHGKPPRFDSLGPWTGSEIQKPGQWWRKQIFAGNLDATQPGDSELFGASQCAPAFDIFSVGGPVGEYGHEALRLLINAAHDDCLRHTHHLVDGVPYRWESGDGVRTYSDVPDARVASNMLGGVLPETNAYLRDTHDEEHYDDLLSEVCLLSGCPIVERIARNRLQMALAYRRRWDPWMPVSRAVGRYLSMMASYAVAFPDERDRIKVAIGDFLRVVLNGWQGGKEPGAWFRPLVAQNYSSAGVPLAVSPWQEAIAARGLWAVLRNGLVEQAIRGAVQEMTRAVARTVVRCFERDANGSGRWCTEYATPYSTSPDPQPIAAPSVTAIQTTWCYAGLVVASYMFDTGDPALARAQEILSRWPKPSTAAEVQWMAL